MADSEGGADSDLPRGLLGAQYKNVISAKARVRMYRRLVSEK